MSGCSESHASDAGEIWGRVYKGEDLLRGSQVQVVGSGLYICWSRLSLQPIHFGPVVPTALGEASAPGHTQIGNAESTSPLSQALTGWVCWGKLRAEAPGLSEASPPTCMLSSLLFYGCLIHNSCRFQPAPGMWGRWAMGVVRGTHVGSLGLHVPVCKVGLITSTLPAPWNCGNNQREQRACSVA